MIIQGHIENGIIVPNDTISLPEGTEVTIVVRSQSSADSASMSPEQQEHYLAALRRIDELPNENPGDTFSGADHDRVLYGEGP